MPRLNEINPSPLRFGLDPLHRLQGRLLACTFMRLTPAGICLPGGAYFHLYLVNFIYEDNVSIRCLSSDPYSRAR